MKTHQNCLIPQNMCTDPHCMQISLSFRLYLLLLSSSLLSGVGTSSVLCNKTTQSICIRHISSVRFCRVWQQPTFPLLFSHFTEGKFCSVSLTSTMWVRRRLFSTVLANNTHVDKSFREFQHFASFEVSVRVKCLWLSRFLGLRQRLQHSSKAANKFLVEIPHDSFSRAKLEIISGENQPALPAAAAEMQLFFSLVAINFYQLR